ncbi:MAG: hypothetical protein ACLQHS_04180 [Candidatus Limnocylindrales bacterium]
MPFRDRIDDRKAAGGGPSGGWAITSNRDYRCASWRTAGLFGRFFARPDPEAGEVVGAALAARPDVRS